MGNYIGEEIPFKPGEFIEIGEFKGENSKVNALFSIYEGPITFHEDEGMENSNLIFIQRGAHNTTIGTMVSGITVRAGH
ncbi:hypothetical protein HOF65_03885 [bacterium]|jgi:hypothetical protein|nr:hypothetical protein [bacterium]MBT3853110.1 hypothetical protein [bacterium]MBT6778517.1 hypothetical protein [bacterium]